MVRDTDSNILSNEKTSSSDEGSIEEQEPWENSYIILNLLASSFASHGDTQSDIENSDLISDSSPASSENSASIVSEFMMASNDESSSGSRGYMTIGPSVSGNSTSGRTTSYENPCTDCTSIEELNTGIPGRVEVGPGICKNDEPEIGLEVDVTQED